MADPSEYELAAWRDVQRFEGRPLTRGMQSASERVSNGAAELSKRAMKFLEGHPKAQEALSRGQEAVTKGAHALGTGARGVADAVPDGMTDWGRSAVDSMRQTAARVSRAGLSSKRVVSRHQKRGHDVKALADVRRLDLERVDSVRGRGASWYYPAVAALSGAGAGVVITGGQLAVTVSGGVATAPSGGAIAGAVIGDATVVLGLASRCVGNVSLLYGYDPEEPSEKLFVMSVVNAGTAMSATATTAAMADISRLTQALVRGKAWAILDKSLVAQVSKAFAKAFGARFTRQSLGKVVPAAGIVLGGTFNWATLESIVDAADVAYRRRFLLEKYPQLGEEEAVGPAPAVSSDSGDDADEAISVLDELADVGGPDLR